MKFWKEQTDLSSKKVYAQNLILELKVETKRNCIHLQKVLRGLPMQDIKVKGKVIYHVQ